MSRRERDSVKPQKGAARGAAIEALEHLGIRAGSDGRNWTRMVEGPAGASWGEAAPTARLRQDGRAHPPSVNPGQIEEASSVVEWFESDMPAGEILERAGSAYRQSLRLARSEPDIDTKAVAGLGARLRDRLLAGLTLVELDEQLRGAVASWRASWRIESQELDLEERLGLMDYPASYPLARSIGRQIDIFCGPTNSGKTYAALNILAQSAGGAYLAPLRLLAMEGQEGITAMGQACSMITGEERREVPGARFVSSTVEMADFSHAMEVAIVDEAQMLADPDRGWAWTAAICGIPARRLIVVCAPEACGLVKALVERCGETATVRDFERKGGLVAEAAPVAPGAIEAGDALIAFSRRNALAWRERVVGQGLSCAVIYGALSAEARRAEARRFQNGEAQVLVATDAIGMGLNLPIKRVIFTTCEKFDGSQTRTLRAHEIRQISGRAGRFGLAENGRAGALDIVGARLVRNALTAHSPPLAHGAILSPNETQIQEMSGRLGVSQLAPILRFFRERLVKHDPFFSSGQMQDVVALAEVADRRTGLSLSDRFAYAKTPLNREDPEHLKAWEGWMRAQERGMPARAQLETARPRTQSEEDALHECERAIKLITAYLWLSWRFPEGYPDREKAIDARDKLSGHVEMALAKMGRAQGRKRPEGRHSSTRSRNSKDFGRAR